MENYSENWKSGNPKTDEPVCRVPSPNKINYSKMKKFSKFSQEEDFKDDATGDNSGSSLPLHCIVEVITSLVAAKLNDCPYKEGIDGQKDKSKWWECACRNIETSSCVLVPANTAMNDLVGTVLTRLGYASNTSASAMGSILIRNWKALSIDTITPGPKITVGEMLGDLSALATLRIQVLRPKSSLQEIKDNLLSYLIKKNRNLLSSNSCPLDIVTLSKICENSSCVKKNALSDPSEELRQKFDSWLKHQLKNEVVNCNPPAPLESSSTNESSFDKFFGKIDSGSENYSGHKEIVAFDAGERPKHYTPNKTRMRTSFDPELELPKLHKWYMENPHPTRQQIHEYVQELNSLESRKGRKQLDVNNVVYWFKNARAAQKRTECRRFCALPVHTINRNVLRIPLGKNSSSITSDDQRSVSDDEASATSDMEDYYQKEEERCQQDLDNWNSREKENISEDQISKNDHIEPIIRLKEEQMSDNENSSQEGILSIAEESNEPIDPSSIEENHQVPRENQFYSNQNREEFNSKLALFHRGNRDKDRNVQVKIEENEKMDQHFSTSPKTQLNNHFALQKENNGISNHAHEAFLSRYKSGFSVSPDTILGHSFMYMTQYMNSKPNNLQLSSEERRKRNRTFIDPVTEVPRLEQWFRLSTHPSHNLIARYTEELNGMPYRRKFPKLETKNVQFWFKNRRAKNKRLNYLEAHN